MVEDESEKEIDDLSTLPAIDKSEDSEEPLYTENLIDEFCDILRGYTNSPESFIQATSFWLVSSTLGKFVQRMITKGKYPRPNIFVVLSSFPGIGRRSTVVAPAETCHIKAWEDYYRSNITNEEIEGFRDAIWEQETKNMKKEEKSNHERISVNYARSLIFKIKTEYLTIEEFTKEGLGDAMETVTIGQGGTAFTIGREHLSIIATEFGLAFESKNVHMNADQIISKLKDGFGLRQVLSKRGGKKGKREIPEGLFVTLLGEMQEFDVYLKQKHLRSGLIRKFIPVYAAPGEMGPWKSATDIETFPHYKINEFAKKLTKRMEKLKDMNLIAMYDGDTKEATDKVSQQIDGRLRIKTEFDIEFLDISYDRTMIDLCCVHALAEPELNIAEEGEDKYLFITMKDLDAANKFMNLVLRHRDESMEGVMYPKDKRKMVLSSHTWATITNHMKRICKEENRDWITKAELFQLKQARGLLKENILTMIEAENIIPFQLHRKEPKKHKPTNIEVFTFSDKPILSDEVTMRDKQTGLEEKFKVVELSADILNALWS